MTRRPVFAVVAITLMVLAGGCGFFRKTKSSFYSLETIPSQASVAAAGLPIGIDAIELPPGLDRRGIVVRKENGQLQIRETEQWAAPLESMVLHTLAFDLARRLPEGMVILPGQVKPIGGVRAIDVILEDFAAGPERVFVLDARWVLREPGPGRPEATFHERITADMRSLDSAEIASATSRALAVLADRIAARLAAR